MCGGPSWIQYAAVRDVLRVKWLHSEMMAIA